nr:MAG TPA: hypothetical protein [Caudoviricetes sp.]
MCQSGLLPALSNTLPYIHGVFLLSAYTGSIPCVEKFFNIFRRNS